MTPPKFRAPNGMFEGSCHASQKSSCLTGTIIQSTTVLIRGGNKNKNKQLSGFFTNGDARLQTTPTGKQRGQGLARSSAPLHQLY